MMLKGSCLCGSIRYEAAELNGPYVYCHCTSCRKSNGTAFAANISSPINSFNVVSGAELLKYYESSPGKKRHFCSQCGSPLYTTVGTNPEHVRIRLGSLDTEFSEPLAAHIFVSERAPWHTIPDDALKFEHWPDSDALRIPGSRQPKPS